MSQTERQELLHRREKCRGRKYDELIRLHGLCQHTFRGNLIQLQAMLRDLGDPETTSGILGDKNRQTEAKGEVVRLLHNFLAAAMTLVDHNRVLKNRGVIAGEFLEEYEKRKNEAFAEDPLSRFVQGLRVYIVHRGVPLGGIRGKLWQQGHALPATLFLHRSALEDWVKWSKEAKQFIKESPAKILLNDVIKRYGEKVEAFQSWFTQRFNQEYKSELDELREIDKQLHHGSSRKARGH